MIHGRNLLIYANGTVVAAARTCRISMDVDIVEVSNPSGRSKSYLAGRKGWTVSATQLVTNFHSRFEGLGTLLRLSFAVRSGGAMTDDRMTGQAFITRSEVTATVGSLTSGNFQFQGTGPLTYQNGVL